MLHLPPLHVPPLQSELLEQLPHWPLAHLPTLQSELELQLPHLPPEHFPLPPQSEDELHAATSSDPSSSSREIVGATFA